MMTHNLKTWVVIAALAATLLPDVAAAENNASCSVAGGTLVDSVLNGSEGEDENFLGAKSRGLPQIIFAVDASPHMRKLPQDLDSDDVRAASKSGDGGGCENPLVDDLLYRANPCVDAKGKKGAYGSCDPLTKLPPGWLLKYSSSTTYVPYDSAQANLFQSAKYYLYDYGWGADANNPHAYADGAVACNAAGATSVEMEDDCEKCVAEKGYWLPPKAIFDAGGRPVMKGNWLNFNPPKYVIARRVLKDQFTAMDGDFRNRQAMIMTMNTNASRCYSDRTAILTEKPLGFDSLTQGDGAEFIGSGATTGFKPTCAQFGGSPDKNCVHNGSSGGGRDSFLNKVDQASSLFTHPTQAPLLLTVPGDAPAGTTQVSFEKKTEGTTAIYRAYFTDVGGKKLNGGKEAICAPYAEMLLNAGQYFASSDFYDTTFTATAADAWEKSQFNDPEGICGADSCTCPRATVIMIAGGTPGFDDNLPCEITGKGCASIVDTSKVCGATTAGGNLARVARFLATTNVKPGATGYSSDKVSVNTFIIGFGTRNKTLIGAAEAGNGQFIEASDAQSLKSAINEALELIATAELSFSNANVTAVQTRTATSLVVPRFTPSKKAFWPGKLSLFELWSEDVCGCVVGNDKSIADCDKNKDGKCGGMFFRDKEGSFIASDEKGEFRKAVLTGGVFVAKTPPASGVDTTLAVPFWEASKEIPDDSARKIYTVLDANNDGHFDYEDAADTAEGQIEFTTTNVKKLLPYLNLSKEFCGRIAARLGETLTHEQCATKVIEYVRGIDVFKEECSATAGNLRPQRLGDIFHSSPVVVEAPMSTRSPVCRLGLSTQCLVSLDNTAIPNVTPSSAYEAFLESTLTIDGSAVKVRRRDRFILVGANDGMLHAFDFGKWDKEDTSTETLECPDEANGICPGYFTNGTGKELWAFIPPDMLPKLQRMLEGRHQYYIDGTPMVREIWADTDSDFKKDSDEFKTVAIVGERRGGVHYFALDVTHPRSPKFRWLFPQPNTMLARAAGESFSDFLPTAPPIGPIRIRNDSSPHNYDETKFEERWVSFLSGGYDQSRSRGRMVNVVDAWYGGGGAGNKETAIWTWRPSKPASGGDDDVVDDNKDVNANAPVSTGGTNRGFSIAATVGLVAYGEGPRADTNSNGYYFDTATVGDTGGQLWTLRFNDPDPKNWSGGLVFRETAGSQCSRQPIFQVTANVIAYDDGRLQTLVGTGDRFNLRDRYGGECSQQNLMACVRRGCNLSVKTRLRTCGREITYQRRYDSGTPDGCNVNDDVLTFDSSDDTSCCDEEVSGVADYEMRCPVGTTTAEIDFRKELTCTQELGAGFEGFACEIKKETPYDICANFPGCNSAQLVPGTTTSPPYVPKNGFYSVKTFDPSSASRAAFNGVDKAKVYTTNTYLQDTSGMIEVNPYISDTATTAAANDSSLGWFFEYGGVAQRTYPTEFTAVDTANAPYNERTTSQATVFGGCAFFSSFTPKRESSVCGGVSDKGVTTRYRLHYRRGDACRELSTEAAQKFAMNSALLPEAPDQVMLSVRPDGMISVGVASMPREGGHGGATSTGVTEGSAEPTATFQIGLGRDMHQCRHPEGTGPEDYAGQRAELVANKACQ